MQLWNRKSQRATPIDAGEALNFLAWSKTGPELALGSERGNLYLYNGRSTKMVPIRNKHPTKITCGCWNMQSHLALSSEDRQITVSDNTASSRPACHCLPLRLPRLLIGRGSLWRRFRTTTAMLYRSSPSATAGLTPMMAPRQPSRRSLLTLAARTSICAL